MNAEKKWIYFFISVYPQFHFLSAVNLIRCLNPPPFPQPIFTLRMSTWLLIGSVLCAWAMLSLLGGERSRRLFDIQSAIQEAQEAENQPAEPIAKTRKS